MTIAVAAFISCRQVALVVAHMIVCWCRSGKGTKNLITPLLMSNPNESCCFPDYLTERFENSACNHL